MTSTVGKSHPAEPRMGRICKRTILFLALSVFLPWILISGPGQELGGGGTAGLNVSFREHGWPFICCDSVQYDRYAHQCGNTLVQGAPLPDGFDAIALAKEEFKGFFSDTSGFRIDLRTKPDFWFDHNHWSNSAKWPFFRSDSYFQIRWLGLICNLLALVCVALAIGVPFNRWLTGGATISLRVALLCIIPISIATAYIVSMFRDHHNEVRLEAEFDRMHEERLIYFDADHGSRLPLFLSQLLDHGGTSASQPTVFRKIRSAHWKMNLGCETEYEQVAGCIERVRDLLGGVPDTFIFRAECNDYGPEMKKNLNKLAELPIQELMLIYDFRLPDDWQDKERKFDLSMPDLLKHTDLRLDFVSKLQGLRHLELWLDEDVSQRDQLSPFIGMKRLKEVILFGVSEVGAKYLLETSELWPSDVELHVDRDVPEDLKKKLFRRFPQ